jgi:hypothetical protein
MTRKSKEFIGSIANMADQRTVKLLSDAKRNTSNRFAGSGRKRKIYDAMRRCRFFITGVFMNIWSSFDVKRIILTMQNINALEKLFQVPVMYSYLQQRVTIRLTTRLKVLK